MSSFFADNAEPNHSSELGHQIETLKVLDSRITLLEDQIENAKSERIRVQDRILYLQARGSHILRLPHEVLTLVFEYHPEDQMRRNASLMFVCTSWYKLVMNTSWLWASIVLKLKTLERVWVMWKYAHACIERSWNSPLDIFIDAQSFGSRDYELWDILDGTPIRGPGGDCPYNDDNRFGHLIRGDTVEIPTIYEYGVFIALGILSGEECEHVSRWRTLRVDLHYWLSYDALYNILQSLTGKKATHLVEFDLRGVGGDYASVDLSMLAGMVGLKSVVLGASVSNEAYSTPLPHIENLSLIDLISQFDLSTLNHPSFQSLRSLELYGEILPDVQPGSVILPTLKYLALEDRYDLPNFDIPQLTHLSIESGREKFPPNVVSAVTDFRFNCYLDEEEDLSEDLMSIVRLMPLLRRVHLPARRFHRYLHVSTILREMVDNKETAAYCVDNPTSWPVTILDLNF